MSYNESLRADSNYPPMTQSQWDNAPWNEERIPEKEFTMAVSQTLSKDVKVVTNDYTPESDEFGTYENLDDTSWNEVFMENNYLTPLQLIEQFKQLLEQNLSNGFVFKTPAYTKRLIEECSNWVEDEIYYGEV